jgi:hypothetical protein
MQQQPFRPPALVPEGTYLVLDHELGQLFLLSDDDRIVQRVSLTEQERMLLAELLKIYPVYCSYELALATITGLPYEECRKHVQMARTTRTMDVLLQSARSTLATCNNKVREAKLLKIAAVPGTGYVLLPYQR